MNFKPLSNRVAVVANEAERVTGAGLVIPDAVARSTWRGTVVAVGPGPVNNRGERVPIALSVGDEVTFARGLGVKWESDDGEIVIMSADAIIGRVE